MSQAAKIHGTRKKIGNKLVYTRQVVEDVQNQEMQSYRRGDSGSEPTLTRNTYFSVKGDESNLKYFMMFNGIDREVYWPEFIENGDVVTFIAQAPIFSSGAASVVGYVNHTKGSGIQMSMLSRVYVLFLCGLFSILAAANLAEENLGTLGYVLALSTLFFSSIIFMRSAQKKSFQNDFERHIKENEQDCAFFEKEKRSQAFRLRYEKAKEAFAGDTQELERAANPDEVEKQSFDMGETAEVDVEVLTTIPVEIAKNYFPNINTVSKNSSQQRYLDSFSSRRSLEAKDVFSGGAEVLASYDSKQFDGIEFDELVKRREKNLWHIYYNSQVLGVVIVEEETALLGRYLYGEVIPKKGVTIEALEQGRVRHCKSGSSRNN